MPYEKRIIIGGLPRSGSTLLRFMLDAASTIISGPETAFFTQPLFQQQATIARLAQRLADKLNICPERLTEAVITAPTSCQAYDSISDLMGENAGISKPCWAEKSPRNCFSYHRLHAENPNFYFISTIRHGLDVVTSVVKNHPNNANQYWCPIQRYVDTMLAIYSFKSPRHLIVKYEDMVTSPQKTMNQIFAFLGLKYEDHIIQSFRQPASTRDLTKVHQPKLKQEISSDWINRWKALQHSERVNEFMQHSKAVYWLEHSGYELPQRSYT
ncbi:Sulfotransferase domain protein [Anaerohalosphaera lusitana]|uniref:Sulfotransferase domain protein n=1 Tax=Anaerohalosphaera lusitana TaxID=1936003 RepID=A0A1U9NNW8_9BACT|nr:sulfotransferase [Anaerohalosphaera lusitana]AQT69603.1 Sulfotransferase domain protein [Anaerohalosphaera lusitana]